MNIHVGDTITLDEIEVYVLAAKDEDGTWDSNVGAIGVEFIGVDKNHDLSYYIAGSDYVDESESVLVINTANKYGYEWGGFQIETGINAESIGSGLSNTNSLINMNLQPYYDGWYVVWDKIKEFRQDHSDKWFLPSKDELNLIYEARNNLSDLTTIDDSVKNSHYWSSSEYSSNVGRFQDSSNSAWSQNFGNGYQSNNYKYLRGKRSRLCRYITNSDFYTKKTWVEDEIITSTELNRIETRVKELHSSYEPHEWVNDEVITAEKLNNIETQLGTSKTWLENELITDIKLNNIEDQLV